MYDGTLADDWRALITFQQMIVLCDADGTIDMTPSAISRRTGIPIEHIKAGIEILQNPDPYSRTPEEEGRRIRLLDDNKPWGWYIVNHSKYKALQDADAVREQNRLRKKRQREREKESRTVTDSHGPSLHTDTNTNTDNNKNILSDSASPQPTIRGKYTEDIEKVFEYWKEIMQHPRSVLDDKRKKLIRNALKIGYSVEQCLKAVHGCSVTPHNIGDNDRNARYDGLHIIFKDADHIDRFIHNSDNPPKTNIVPEWAKLPQDNNELSNHAKKHNLSPARPGESHFQYRERLRNIIDKRLQENKT